MELEQRLAKRYKRETELFSFAIEPNFKKSLKNYHAEKKLIKQKEIKQKKLKFHNNDFLKEWIPLYGIIQKVQNIVDDKELDKYKSLADYFQDNNKIKGINCLWLSYQCTIFYLIHTLF